MSLRGESRSCGSVSQAGKTATEFSVDEAGQRRGEVLGLAPGGGDREHGPLVWCPASAATPNGRSADGAISATSEESPPRLLEGGGQLRFGGDKVKQSGKTHQIRPQPHDGNTTGPGRKGRGGTAQGYSALGAPWHRAKEPEMHY